MLRRAAAGRLVAEALATYKQDAGNISRRVYAAPWDMSLRHRQASPAFVADRGARFIAEAAATLRRRDEAKPDGIWLRSALYPECEALRPARVCLCFDCSRALVFWLLTRLCVRACAQTI